MNCLAYALRFWETNPDYRLYYNSDHVINSKVPLPEDIFLPVEMYGWQYFRSAFNSLLDEYETILLNKYFNRWS